MTLGPLIVGIAIFVVVLAGAFAGWAMRQRLPEHNLTDETKNVVSVSMATVATLSALVLGLLISNANSSFNALGSEVTTLSAQILRLDQILRRYGSDADSARQTLLEYANQKAVDLFPEQSRDVELNDPATYQLLQQLEDEMLGLKPADARDQWWLGQAMTLAGKIGDARWLISQQVGQGTPKAFVALLAFWLTSLFVSFGLFAPRNVTTALFLTLCAMAVAGAVGMILELEKGFGGVVHISPQPMRQAVETLEADWLSHLLRSRHADLGL
jgi:outer membrane murein-binding lipoprotein Lpp